MQAMAQCDWFVSHCHSDVYGWLGQWANESSLWSRHIVTQLPAPIPLGILYSPLAAAPIALSQIYPIRSLQVLTRIWTVISATYGDLCDIF